MSKRRARSDDVLFISALAAVLVGIALLLATTHAFPGAYRAWPLVVMAAGGALLYAALVRRSSPAFLFGGIAFVLEGAFLLAAVLLGLGLGRAWPLAMVVGGIAGLVGGFAAWRRAKPSFVVTSICFIFLGSIFSLFSFGLVRQGFRQFIAAWWPSFLILGGILLFAAYGLLGRGGVRSPRRGKARSQPRRRDSDRQS